MKRLSRLGCFFTLIWLMPNLVQANTSFINGDNGYRLWLKYDALPENRQKRYGKQLQSWRIMGQGATHDVIRTELNAALPKLLGRSIAESTKLQTRQLLILNAPDQIQEYGLTELAQALDSEGYALVTGNHRGNKLTFVVARSPVGSLYGTYALLRMLQTGQDIEQLKIIENPKIQLRVLNHWDNLDRHVERGYAGQSIWDWHKLPGYQYQRYHDYARANASIAINGTVLNNVNADPLILKEQYLEKVTALADTFRPYGIKVYLSIKFSSPQLLGGLKTSDPLNKEVQIWWENKVKDIYQRIPDFGGFLVKANSEGQPGPGDFGRSHAEGANMLADVLAPHGGMVMWRAFVYANENKEERSKQAYSEFKPLDGQFHNNVLVQVKNGPIDFQPREPISPLFGAMPQTPLMMEFQITLEYLGFSTHLVYLGPLYEEVLTADTFAMGKGSTVAKVIDGSLFDKPISGIAGVANIGTDPNWTGHPFLQANWYLFGRMAWDHRLSAKTIADEWIRMTLTRNVGAADKISAMMMASRETTVNYMTPLGLHHIMGVGHHYGPGPWVKDLARDDWTSVYYHRADTQGIGFDRTPSGENSVEQYFSPLREQLSSPATTPEALLLWFHHLPWDYQMKNNRSLWNELVYRYYQGAAEVEHMAQQWQSLAPFIDPLPHKQVAMSLAIQTKEAIWWRNACILYFQQFSQRPIPEDLEPIEGDLKIYQQQSFPYAPGRG